MYAISSYGVRYSGCFRRFWSKICPKMPMERATTNSAFRQPIFTMPSISSFVNEPVLCSMSTKEMPMQPSTFRIRLPFFEVVNFSTSSA